MPRLILNGYSHPYDVVSALPADLTTSSDPRYNSIILTDRAFNGGNYAQLRDYAAKYVSA